MPMLRVKGIPKEEVIEESTVLVDAMVDILGCPRDYITIELINNIFIMDGKEVSAPTIIEVGWFDRGQEVKDKIAKIITDCFKKDRKCLDVVFSNLDTNSYYENGEHF